MTDSRLARLAGLGSGARRSREEVRAAIEARIREQDRPDDETLALLREALQSVDYPKERQ